MFSIDLLQVVFWSITYILIIVFSIIKHSYFMPIIAGFLNFSWEINALYFDLINGSYNFVTIFHFIWVSLDFLIMVIIFFYYIDKNKKMLLTFVSIPVLVIVINFIFTVKNGQLHSCFIIDIIMAICYLVFSIKSHNNIIELTVIGITKLIGDFFAFIMYRQDTLVNIIGIIVFVINAIYLIILNNKPINKIKLTINKNEIY